jgi:hypothetical protein
LKKVETKDVMKVEMSDLAWVETMDESLAAC